MRRNSTRPDSLVAGVICLGSLACVLGGCGSRQILTTHEPMHTVGGYVTLKAVATGHVDRIELYVERFDVDAEGNESTDMPKSLVQVCNPFMTKKTLTCTYELAYSGDAKIIEFHGRAVYPGRADKDEIYRFASGVYPVSDKPTPIRAKRDPDDGLDVVIVPDPDLINQKLYYPWDSFRLHLDDVVEDIYFGNEMIREHRDDYNFWYVPGTASYTGQCEFDGVTRAGEESVDRDFTDSINALADAFAYLHVLEKRDCAQDPRFSAEIWYDKSILHESGHVLYGLRDEYPVDNADEYPPKAVMGNTFLSEGECTTEARVLDLPDESCERIFGSNIEVWRVDSIGPRGCLMGPDQHAAWSDFGPACRRRINWTHGGGEQK